MAENDPHEPGWHKIKTWNDRVFADARAKTDAAFDAKLADHDRRHGRAPVEPQTGLDVGSGAGTGFRANA